MKRLILHIGRHKTGTTSVQLFLNRNQEALRAQNILYPQSGRDVSAGQSPENRAAHHKIALCLSSADPSSDEYLRAFAAELTKESRDYSTIILSSEAFQNVSDMSRVANVFEGYSIEAIGYLREYLSYVASAYAQEVKGSNLVADFEFFEQKFSLNLRRFIDRWSSVANKTTWRLYNRSALHNGDIVSDFARVAELPFGDDGIRDESNISISGNLLGFKLLANSLGLNDPYYGTVIRRLAAENPRFRGPIYLDREEQRRIRRRNSCNTTLAEMFECVDEADFEKGNKVFETDTIEADFAHILSELKDFQAVYEHPILRKLSGENFPSAI